MRIIVFHRNYSSENMCWKYFQCWLAGHPAEWFSNASPFAGTCVLQSHQELFEVALIDCLKKKSLPVFSMAINDRCGCVCIAFACNNRDDAHPTSNKNLLTHERWQAPNRICIIKRCRCSVVWSGISSRNSNRRQSRNWKRSNWILLIGRWNKHVRVLWAFYCFEQARSIVK